jgi:hypothetical protein
MGSLVLPSRYDSVVLELTPTKHPFDGDFAVVPTWEAKLTGFDLEVSRVCPEAEEESSSLAEFFEQLFEDRLGWEDERTWESQEGRMRLNVTHDGVNTVRVDVTLEGGGIEPRWRVTGQLFTDPGIFQQLSANARLFGDASLPQQEESQP